MSLVLLTTVARCDTAVQDTLPFLDLGTTPGVDRVFLERLDDITSLAINITYGFPFANTTHNSSYVSLCCIVCSGMHVATTLALIPKGWVAI